MSNKYSKNYEGIDVLTLGHDGSMETDITVEDGRICLFSSYDRYDSSYNSFNVDDWLEIKEFIDEKIIDSMGVPKSLLGEVK